MLPLRLSVPGLLMAAALVAGGCSNGAAASSAPATSSPALPAASAALELPVADPLKSDFHASFDKPVLPHGSADSWYPLYNGPTAAVFADGKFHVYHDGTSTAPQSLGYKLSTDGLSFTAAASDQPILTPAMLVDAGVQMSGNLNIGTVLLDGKTWVMYFTAGRGTGTGDPGFHGSIARATADSPAGPWKIDPTILLGPGLDDAWDASGVGYASVIRTGGSWSMYFSQGYEVGMATSKDGVKWTRYDDPGTTDALYSHGDPVLQDDGTGKFVPLVGDKAKVAAVGSGWIMTYHDTSGDILYSTSRDGIRWTAPVTIVSASETGMSIYMSAMLVHDGKAYLYIEAGSQAATDGYLVTWKA